MSIRKLQKKFAGKWLKILAQGGQKRQEHQPKPHKLLILFLPGKFQKKADGERYFSSSSSQIIRVSVQRHLRIQAVQYDLQFVIQVRGMFPTSFPSLSLALPLWVGIFRFYSYAKPMWVGLIWISAAADTRTLDWTVCCMKRGNLSFILSVSISFPGW